MSSPSSWELRIPAAGTLLGKVAPAIGSVGERFEEVAERNFEEGAARSLMEADQEGERILGEERRIGEGRGSTLEVVHLGVDSSSSVNEDGDGGRGAASKPPLQRRLGLFGGRSSCLAPSSPLWILERFTIRTILGTALVHCSVPSTTPPGLSRQQDSSARDHGLTVTVVLCLDFKLQATFRASFSDTPYFRTKYTRVDHRREGVAK